MLYRCTLISAARRVAPAALSMCVIYTAKGAKARRRIITSKALTSLTVGYRSDCRTPVRSGPRASRRACPVSRRAPRARRCLSARTTTSQHSTGTDTTELRAGLHTHALRAPGLRRLVRTSPAGPPAHRRALSPVRRPYSVLRFLPLSFAGPWTPRPGPSASARVAMHILYAR